jgi:hypothetical protein
LPTPQPKPQLDAVDVQPITAIEIINPSILLMDYQKSLKILLSRNTLIERQAVHLRGVRLIEIPLGWRLALMRLASRFCNVRLSDELEFVSLEIDTREIPSPVSALGAVIGRARDPSLLLHLTGSEYKRLCEMNGRTLHRWVVEQFGLTQGAAPGLPTKRRLAA